MSEQNQSEDGKYSETKVNSGPSVEGGVAQSSKIEHGPQQSESSNIDQAANSSLPNPEASAAALPSTPRKESEAVPSLYTMVKRRRVASLAAGATDGSNDETLPRSLLVGEDVGTRELLVGEDVGTRDRKASSNDESKPMDTEGDEKASTGASLSSESATSTKDAVKKSGKSIVAALAAGATDESNDETLPRSLLVGEDVGTRDRKASSNDESKPMDTEGNEKASTGASLSSESAASTKDAVKKSGKSKVAADNDSGSSDDAQGEDIDAQSEDSKAPAAGRKGNIRGRPKRSCVGGRQIQYREMEEDDIVEEDDDKSD
jgi:hypothetical protein